MTSNILHLVDIKFINQLHQLFECSVPLLSVCLISHSMAYAVQLTKETKGKSMVWAGTVSPATQSKELTKHKAKKIVVDSLVGQYQTPE